MRTTNRVCAMKAATIGAICVLSGLQVNAGTWDGDVRVGAGYWSGDATYSIGGMSWAPFNGYEILPDKISELVFPLDVPFASVAGSARWNGLLELHGSVMASLTDPTTKSTDSDWDTDYGIVMTDYSESDAELQAWSIDGGVLFWSTRLDEANRPTWAFGVGLSLLYQQLDWTIGPEWQNSLLNDGSIISGSLPENTGTYKSDIVMPYLNVCADFRAKRFSGRLEAGIGPATVKDEDDHLLREFVSTADMTGFGIKGLAEIRYDISTSLFVLVNVTALSVEASGTSESVYYGGKFAGVETEIDEEFSLTSITGSVGLGYNF